MYDTYIYIYISMIYIYIYIYCLIPEHVVFNVSGSCYIIAHHKWTVAFHPAQHFQHPFVNNI